MVIKHSIRNNRRKENIKNSRREESIESDRREERIESCERREESVNNNNRSEERFFSSWSLVKVGVIITILILAVFGWYNNAVNLSRNGILLESGEEHPKSSSSSSSFCNNIMQWWEWPTTTTATTTTTTATEVIRPFPMPEEGPNYKLFQPIYDMEPSKLGLQLFAPPNHFLQMYRERIEWTKSITPRVDSIKANTMSVEDRADEMYLEMLSSLLSATAFGAAELSVTAGYSYTVADFDFQKRRGGNDWTLLGDTMTGHQRLKNVWDLLVDVNRQNIPGDYIETGVWRGGSSIYARAVMHTLKQRQQLHQSNGQGEEQTSSHDNTVLLVDANTRISYVCDSFAGLPPGDRNLDRGDKNWDTMTGYLGVPEEVVATNFHKYGLLDHNVVFAKGFFNETMPPLSKHIKQLSIMRLDGDMYESTVDVLYHLYDKLSIGGYVIMDDWFGFPSKTACEDFFAVHGIQPEILPIDQLSTYWKKTEQVEIQYWRYQQNKFKPGDEKN